MALTRPPVLPVWADTGDKTQPSDLDIAAGWPVTSIPPSRQRFNWFFNWAANAVRYFSRRGIPDWIATETFEIGDIQRSLVDGKTYRSIVAANINFEPSANPTKWERWGFSLSELWAYITSGLNGGTCPDTGPAAAPTLANPYTQYTGVTTGEKWQWVGGAWCVVGKYYGVEFANASLALTGAVQYTFMTETMPRNGSVISTLATMGGATTAGHKMLCWIEKNAMKVGADTALGSATADQIFCNAAAEHEVSAGDVVTFIVFSGNTQSIPTRAGFRYTI